MPAKTKPKKPNYSEEKYPNDLLEIYSPLKVGRIPQTSTKKKENVFRNFQPRSGACLDYNISETFVKWDVGDTKINVKDTKATYVPAPPESVKVEKKKKIKYSHGGPPQWEFVDEIWRRKEEEVQVQNKKNFEEFVKRRNQRYQQHARMLHSLIMSMAGPTWFQELSPKQIGAVDELRHSMFLDYRDNTIIHTAETVAYLGLVLRPNSRHVELALKFCCGSAVEFLLILYQLIGPKRKSYSVNDRLLLSAVVHLTMTETLRELHVRIPSPPRERKVKTKRQKKVVKKDYKSPYLIPYTFKRDSQKYTGIYENKHIQYPESPYFSYLYSLHWEIQYSVNILDINLSDIDDTDERELFEDMLNAQKLYNVICKDIGSIKLLRPTVKKKCEEFQKYSNRAKKEIDELVLPSLCQLEDTSEKCTCIEPVENIDDASNCCELDFLKECDCEDPCCCKEKSNLFIASLCQRCIAQKQHKNARNIVTGVTVTKSKNVVPILGGTFVEKKCQCLTDYKEKLMAVAARNRIKCQKAQYVIGGVAHTKFGPVYLISTALVKKTEETESETKTCTTKNSKCICDKPPETRKYQPVDDDLDDNKDKVIVEETYCECRKELDRFLEHKCTCEQCRTEAQTTYIMQGIKSIKDKPVNIIGGVQDQRCDCLQKHQETIKKVGEYRDRAMARHDLKQQNVKYMITGVTITSEGPVYCIGGIRPPVQCVCAEVARREKEEEERSRRMARMPDTGRIKYEISGVRHGSQENTFIISKALATEPCSCEKLLDQYEQYHRNCLNYFDEYLEQMAAELDEGEGENSEDSVGFVDCPVEPPSVEVTDLEVMGEAVPQSSTTPEPPELDTGCPASSNRSSPDPPVVVPEDPKDCCDSESEEVSECCRTETDPSIGPLVTTPLSDIQEGEVESNVELKRFVILDKIPCEFRKQQAILKKVLAGMADDGFPLAKLPDCHKLPHFKLWMQFRCGKFWTQKDRRFYENFSKFGSKHTQLCYHEIPMPYLGLSYGAAEQVTWNDANSCRKLIKQKYEIFHRAIKQQRINGAREYFPLTFSYEFPTPTFRDCYFAYFPSKEEDVLAG